MGYVNERSSFLNKNHREVCKFETPTDSDFITLRNALASTVEAITRELSAQRHAHHRTQLQFLQEYLGIQDKPEDDLMELEDTCLPGSCTWFTSKAMFREWRDGVLRASHQDSKGCDSFKAMWLHANPGAGKSVLSSQVIDHLENLNLDCSYYFFAAEDRAKSSLSGLLRSLAYQMALFNSGVRQKLLTMRDGGLLFDKDDEKWIWRKIFLAGVFRCAFDQPQYWVIDALDECKDCDALFPMLAKIERQLPLRILMTSRPSREFKNKLMLLGDGLFEDQILLEDTYNSIKRFIQEGPRSQALGFQDGDTRRELIAKILQKSEGCFLWVDLVMAELEKHAYSAEAVERILEEVPPGMDRLYMRTLEGLSNNPSGDGRNVSKAILNVVVCAIRPLAVPELENVLKIDLDITIFEHTIKSSCGNLIYIDKTKRVCMVHQTARDFLLNKELDSEFAIRSADAHRRLSSVCLQYLKGREMWPLRTREQSGFSASRIAKRSPFADYACTYFSDHVRRSHSDDDHLVGLVHTFLTKNGFSWVEHIAHGGKLDPLVRASQNLRGYLQARAKYKPLLDEKTQRIQQWSIDLTRLVAKFGKNLIRCPSSIYGLIPPLAAPESAVASQYRDPRGIQVCGLSRKEWDDRLCSVSYHGKTATTVACEASNFAVGLQNGAVFVYDHTTFQELKVLQHFECVKILHYNLTGEFLACAGVRKIRMWNVSDGIEVWSQSALDEPLALTFVEQDRHLMAITRRNILVLRDAMNGEVLSRRARENASKDENRLFRGGEITCASFSLDSDMLATVYRGQPITLSDLEHDDYIGCCENDITLEFNAESSIVPVVALVFNPNSEINLLAAAYMDGALALFDPAEQLLKAKVDDAEASKLASSPDGRTLGVGSISGIIMLYEFESLRLLYRIIHSSYFVLRTFAFSSDGQRLVDIRGSQCNVWEPPVLMRSDPGDMDSVSDALFLSPTDALGSDSEDVTEITSILCLPYGGAIICGMDDGSVSLYSTATGSKIRDIYRHASGHWIIDMAWDPNFNVLASVDASSGVTVKKFRGCDAREVESDLLGARLEHPVKQLLFGARGLHLLVATTETITILELQGNRTQRSFPAGSLSRWANNPSNSEQVISVEPDLLRFYDWASLEEVSPAAGIKLHCNAEAQLAVQDVITSSDGKILVLKQSSLDRNLTTVHISLLESSCCRADAEEVFALPHLGPVTALIDHLIGVIDSRLVFLNKDLWVCSLNMNGRDSECIRHMFIPDEWINTKNRLIFQLTTKGDLIFAKRDEIAVIKRALASKVTLNDTTTKANWSAR
ncbi:MAG: hypothetical protein M1839_006695 [Geoglossum umbratile]|nr:MAG: hypothetical protein M1839_006695 [Geoglossum umbratile]